MERTIIYVFTPKRLREDYMNGKQFSDESINWLKIGKASSKDINEDKWDVAYKRIKQEVHTGICETCVLVDVFEYPTLQGNPDDAIRKLMTDDIFDLSDSKAHNKTVKQEDYEIKAGREYVYGASRKQVWAAVAKFERNLLIEYQNADNFKFLIECITKNNETSIEETEDTTTSNLNLQMYDDVAAELADDGINASHPNNKNYGLMRSTKGVISTYSFSFSRRYNQAIIAIETMKGESGMQKIETAIENNDIREILALSSPQQGMKNKEKYAWKLIKSYQEYEEASIEEWFVENLKKVYEVFENLDF